MFTWVLVLAIGIVIGIALGVYFMRLDDEAKRTQQSLQQQLQASKTELQLYKAEVQQSYVTTAHLINNLTDSYKAVHQHLSHSAAALCGDVAAVNKLDLKEHSNQYLQQLQQPPTSTSVGTTAPEPANAPHDTESEETQAQAITPRAQAEPAHVEAHADFEDGNEAQSASLAAPQVEDNAPLANERAPLANETAQLANETDPSQQEDTQTSASSSENATSARGDDSEHGQVAQDPSSPMTSAENNETKSAADVDSQLSNHSRQHRRNNGSEHPSTPMTPEEEEAFQEKLKLEQARVEASRMIH